MLHTTTSVISNNDCLSDFSINYLSYIKIDKPNFQHLSHFITHRISEVGQQILSHNLIVWIGYWGTEVKTQLKINQTHSNILTPNIQNSSWNKTKLWDCVWINCTYLNFMFLFEERKSDWEFSTSHWRVLSIEQLKAGKTHC